MHPLLQRQLKRFYQNQPVSKELEGLLDAISVAYKDFDEDHQMVERTLELSSHEMMERNQELAKALEDLKNAQSQLIQSEKMAVLGQLVAGVAHEVNTPAGAIISASEELKNDYAILLEKMVALLPKLDAVSLQTYQEACRIVGLAARKETSTIQVRENAKAIQTILEGHVLEDERAAAKSLANIGLDAQAVQSFVHLFNHGEKERILETLYQLGMTQIHVKDIQIAIGRIAQLVRALKMYAHSDQEQFSLSDLVNDMENTLIILHNRLKRGITVHRAFQPIPHIKCHPNELNQVWTNIINNAVESMKGQGDLWIRIRPGEQENVMVQFEDNGPGIPAEHLNQIFDPYFTTKPKGEGTGLGLSICKEIIRKHRGTISVQSQPGKTTFTVLIPINQETQREAEVLHGGRNLENAQS